ncbi:uncharacterized protein [Nicotiana sylvestris]|uniref:uncharacterized protein n=1 Tax=Nicotiana sylvestris TaxID=4096 RepID=UPI00388C842F
MTIKRGPTDVASTSGSKTVDQVILTHVQRPPEIQDFKFKSLDDLAQLLDKKLSGLNVRPIDLSKKFADRIETVSDYKTETWSEFNKLKGIVKLNSRYADKPRMQTYYYPRPTPQDVLIEERDWNQTNTSYSGSEIYEWNLDGLTNRQVTILVHRMLMYSTICKSVKNTDITICKIIIAGFTGQLRGWWDNYLSVEEKALVINATTIDEGVDNISMALVKGREDAVYTLILTILEHFNGRFTSNHETIRTLLNGLRCKTFSEFRWYKDTFMSRVMELPENKYEHWKAKFIDGLPSLIAERVRKVLRGSYGEIQYGHYTYGSESDYYSETESEDEVDLIDLSDNDKNIDTSCISCKDPVTRDINALINMKQRHVNSLQSKILCMNIFDTLQSAKVQQKIKLIAEQMAVDVCADHPSAFWNRKRHIVTLPYEEKFSEDDIPTKSRPCQMNAELVEFCKNEIDSLLQKGLIKPSKSPWSCSAFYVNNAAEKERGIPRLVINYKL